MQTHIVLLRAVNLGAIAKVPMPEFCAVLNADGFQNVRSYIASGNIVLESDLSAAEIANRVDEVLHSSFDVTGQRSILRAPEDFARLIKHNPFADAAQTRPNQLHVHFMLNPPQVNAELALTSYKGQERIRIFGAHLFIDYVFGVGESKLTSRFLEQALGTSGTARNWNTVRKIYDLAVDLKVD